MKQRTNILTTGRLLLIVSVLLMSNASAQVLTLDSVLARVDRNNPMLREYDFKVKAMEAYVKGANSWMAPMVGFGPYWFPYKRQEATHDFDPEDGMYMAQIEQDIPNPGKLKARRNYLSSRAAIESQGRAIQFNQLRAEAKQLYYEALVSRKKLSILEENKRIVDLMIKLARIRYPYNQSSLGSIYKAEGRLHEVENMIVMTQGELDEKKIRLKTLMNEEAGFHFEVDSATVVRGESFNSTDTSSLGDRRSDVLQIEKKIAEMRLNQQLQRMNAKPDFRIRFEHMIQRDKAMPNQFSAMAMVTIPIAPWSSKMYRSEVKGMQYEIQAMEREREGILLEARGMIASMQVQLSRMQQQLQNYDTKIIPSLRKNYETVMLAYEENREQLPSVIDGWEGLSMAQMEYVEKLGEFYSMIVQYEKELEK
jgi:outer membrane protein, heavy metal efflux system